MAGILRITDGTTTINLLGDQHYHLIDRSWSPKRASRRISQMGGRSSYEDVAESIPILISADSASLVFEKVSTLSDLLDQAEAWGRNENVDAVKIVYQPDGSALTNPLEAVITGRPGGDGEMLTLPSSFSEVEQGGAVLSPIFLSFTRKGVWLGDTEAETSSASTGNPAVVTATAFTNSFNALVPYDAYVEFSATPVPDYAYVAFADSADKLLVVEGEDLFAHTNMTDTVVSGASGGSVVRTNTSQIYFYIDEQLSSFNDTVQLMAVYVVLKNNSASSHSFALTPRFINDGKTITIAAGDNDIQCVSLGMFSTPATFDALWVFELDIVASASVTSSNELDIDYLIFVGIDDSTRIIKVIDPSDRRIYIEHQLNSELKPRVYDANTSAVISEYPSYHGDALLESSGNQISAVAWGVEGSADWIIEDVSNNELNVTLGVTQTAGYLTPQ